MSRLRLLALALVLFGVQLFSAIHGLEHDLEADDANGPCLGCLALAGTHGAPPPIVAFVPALPAAALVPAIAVPTRLTFTPWPPFHSRAPPLHG